MITSIEGVVGSVENGFAIIKTGGLGYKITTTEDTLSLLSKTKSTVELWTHLAIRENSHDLYGFLTKDDLDFFELLITVSGIGPKTAISILNIATIPTIKKAILTEDPGYLSKASGIGKKTAEKIVLGLKDSKRITSDGGSDTMSDDGDALEALKAIGYSEREARDTLKKIPDTTNTSDRVKQAIKLLGAKK